VGLLQTQSAVTWRVKQKTESAIKRLPPLLEGIIFIFRDFPMLNIRNLELEDLPVIAQLHLDNMPLTFPDCRYYFNLMKLIYSSFLVNKEGISYVATLDNNIVGYVCLHKSSKKIYVKAFRNCPVAFCCNVIMLLLRFPFLFLKAVPRVLRTLSLSRSSMKPEMLDSDFWKEYYELRPIVVRTDKQGTSIADRLISSGENSLMSRGEKRYFLRVRKDNARAIAFYNKMGFTTVRYEDIRIVMIKNVK
jgi:ribosomal protein S18 acetylase RimI-like enzyme